MQFDVIRLKHTIEQETPLHVNVQPTLDVIYKTDVTDVKQHTV